MNSEVDSFCEELTFAKYPGWLCARHPGQEDVEVSPTQSRRSTSIQRILRKTGRNTHLDAHLHLANGGPPYHTVDYGPFIKSQRASTQLTLEPRLVQIWSRDPPTPGCRARARTWPFGHVSPRILGERNHQSPTSVSAGRFTTNASRVGKSPRCRPCARTCLSRARRVHLPVSKPRTKNLTRKQVQT